jgi:hypothetical protein
MLEDLADSMGEAAAQVPSRKSALHTAEEDVVSGVGEKAAKCGFCSTLGGVAGAGDARVGRTDRPQYAALGKAGRQHVYYVPNTATGERLFELPSPIELCLALCTVSHAPWRSSHGPSWACHTDLDLVAIRHCQPVVSTLHDCFQTASASPHSLTVTME